MGLFVVIKYDNQAMYYVLANNVKDNTLKYLPNVYFNGFKLVYKFDITLILHQRHEFLIMAYTLHEISFSCVFLSIVQAVSMDLILRSE